MINEEGLSIDENRVKALTELQAPNDRKSLQSLLGFFGFNRKWIPKYADLTRPMYKIMKRGVPFKWDEECNRNLRQLKEAVIKSGSLAIPDLYDTEQSYELTMDGSKHGMGAHLTQRIKGKISPLPQEGFGSDKTRTSDPISCSEILGTVPEGNTLHGKN